MHSRAVTAAAPVPVRRPAVLRSAAVLMAAAVAAAAAGWLAGWGRVPWWAALVVASSVAAGEQVAARFPVGRQRWAFPLGDAVLAAALVFAPGAWCGVGAAVGMAAARMIRSRRSPAAVPAFLAAGVLAGWVAMVAGGGLWGAGAGLAACWLVRAAVAVARCRRPPAGWLPVARDGGVAAVHFAGACGLGMLGAWLAGHAPAGLLGLVVPLALLGLSAEDQSARAAESDLLAELARLHEQAGDPSPDQSAEVVCAAAARLLGGAHARMLLITCDGTTVYHADRDGPVRRRPDPAALRAGWVDRAIQAGRLSAGRDGRGRPYWAAVLGPPGAPTAVLYARRGPGDGGYSRRELALARVLAEQAEPWLSLAEATVSLDQAKAQAQVAEDRARALGSVGADTAPTLRLLKDSAARLARLADGQPRLGGLNDIVAELHAAERAVASLLGAVALAAEPDLAPAPPAGQHAGGQSQRTGARSAGGPTWTPATEWTTTGVFRG